jgi:hypothetical protein
MEMTVISTVRKIISMVYKLILQEIPVFYTMKKAAQS